ERQVPLLETWLIRIAINTQDQSVTGGGWLVYQYQNG
ncbi:hypothetical protein PHMEG_0008063, partial [Phytophthora megakarya]